MEQSDSRIALHGNPWRIPSEARAFEGMIVGHPTKAQRAERLRQVRAARDAWRPSPEAMAVVHRIQKLIGSRIWIQIWDPIMLLLEDEGPFPIEGICSDVFFREEGGFPQAFIGLSNALEHPTLSGYSALAKYPGQSLLGCAVIPLANINWISFARAL